MLSEDHIRTVVNSYHGSSSTIGGRVAFQLRTRWYVKSALPIYAWNVSLSFNNTNLVIFSGESVIKWSLGSHNSFLPDFWTTVEMWTMQLQSCQTRQPARAPVNLADWRGPSYLVIPFNELAIPLHSTKYALWLWIVLEGCHRGSVCGRYQSHRGFWVGID